MRSMTGCGTGIIRKDGWEVSAELKSVNHRFLDLGLHLPRTLNFLEPVIRTGIAGKIRRGHVDVYITVRRTDESAVTVETDVELARVYFEAACRIAESTGAENDMTASRLMALEGVNVLTEREMDQGLISAMCREALDASVEQLILMRVKEGEHLKKDLQQYLDELTNLRGKVAERAPLVVTEYRDKLITRLNMLSVEGTDPQRLAQEVAITADRCAVDEELARLESHILQMRGYLEAESEIGKKMDFLIQEMNRETNTIGSKASDLAIAQSVVAMKSEIEKMREQIQNVE